MRYLLGIVLALSFSLPACAQTKARIILDQADAGMFPQGWVVVPVPESTFLMLRNRKTETAYTDLVGKVTFVRERYILTAPPARLRHTLLHELGHIACNCAIEEAAEHYANTH
ncbi:MAG TPA: hypothetical protein VNX46_18295 [Candidatus Acidoferrum sp.]|jgi:hypothetical protein|nr:hypothetical protein [Candidatus Acidoferrum sp.]